MSSDFKAGAQAIPCPICRKPIVAEFEPFCSKRCSHVDLSRWLKGSYVIAGEDAADEDVGQRPTPGPDAGED